MTDFADQVRQGIQDQLDKDAQRRAEAEARRKKAGEDHRHAQETLPEIDRVFREAEAASGGAIRYTAPPGLMLEEPKDDGSQSNPISFHLNWDAPDGPRRLTLSVSTRGDLHFERISPREAWESESTPRRESPADAVQRNILEFIQDGPRSEDGMQMARAAVWAEVGRRVGETVRGV